MTRRILILAVLSLSAGLLTAGPAHAVDPPLPDVTQVDAGDRHTCAVADGKAWCWGDDAVGQVGNGPDPASGIAERVLAVSGSGQLSSVAQVAAGEGHSCAVLRNGHARCWGANTNGQLGNGTTTPSDRPVVVLDSTGTAPLTGVRQLTTGNTHTCALLTTDRVRCWGLNGGGQLGDGTVTERHLPVPVRTATGLLGGVHQISAGYYHTCAALENGQARCWGANEVGRIGDGSSADRRRPAVVLAPSGPGPLTQVTQVSAGLRHSCAVLTTGQARCWGSNDFHQLGSPAGSPNLSLRPRVVRTRAAGHPALTGARTIAAGGASSCATLQNREVRCWGSDDDAQLGDGARTGRIGPVPVLSATGVYDPATPGNLRNITHVAIGFSHVCARRTDGRALCWGRNSFGEGGSGAGAADRPRPTSVLAPP